MGNNNRYSSGVFGHDISISRIYKPFYQKKEKKSGNFFEHPSGRLPKMRFPNDYGRLFVIEGNKSGNSTKGLS